MERQREEGNQPGATEDVLSMRAPVRDMSLNCSRLFVFITARHMVSLYFYEHDMLLLFIYFIYMYFALHIICMHIFVHITVVLRNMQICKYMQIICKLYAKYANYMQNMPDFLFLCVFFRMRGCLSPSLSDVSDV